MVFLETFFKEMVSLDSNKATHSNDGPTEIVKANTDLSMNLLFLRSYHLFLSPIHKKKSWLDKSNNRPVSLLSNISKVF